MKEPAEPSPIVEENKSRELILKKQTTDEVALRVNTLHNFVTQRGYETILSMVLCGELLTRKKAELGHTKFTPWIRENLDCSPRTIQYYVLLHKHREQVLMEKPQSLTKAIALLSDTKRLTKGLLSEDEKLLRRNLVTPLKVVRRRLENLPRDPIHYETVELILRELREEVEELCNDLRYC